MSDFIQVIFNGLAVGSSYGLLALALVVVWKSTGVLNFAQGEIGLFGAFVTWQCLAAGVHYYLAVLAGMAASAALAATIERLAIRPILSDSHFPMMIMAIGLYIGVNAMTSMIWGSAPQAIASPFSGALHLGGQFIPVSQVLAIGVGIAIVVALSIFFRTRWGVRIRAIAEDRTTPRLLGVRIGRTFTLAWGIGGAMAQVALLLYTQGTLLSNVAGANLIIPATVAATVGGFSSIVGAFVGGLVLGLLESLAGFYISSSAKSAVSLLVVIAILMVRRQGLFGAAQVREV